MKALLQIGSSLSACLPERVRSQSGGHAQAGGRVTVPPEKRFLINQLIATSEVGLRGLEIVEGIYAAAEINRRDA